MNKTRPTPKQLLTVARVIQYETEINDKTIYRWFQPLFNDIKENSKTFLKMASRLPWQKPNVVIKMAELAYRKDQKNEEN